MRRFRTRTTCLVLTSIVIVIILRFLTGSTVPVKPELDRDYVLQQQPELQPSRKPKVTHSVDRKLVLKRQRRKINVVHVKHVSVDGGGDTYDTANLMTWNGNMTIFIHNPETDMISSYVKDYGTWEKEFLEQIGTVFRTHKNLVFLDIGCNIGIYSLFIANLGAQVMAIDAVKSNLKLLSQSVEKGGLTDRVMLVWNAVSNSHDNVTLQIPEGNIGGAHLIEDENKPEHKHTMETVETIVLDDLVNLDDTMNSEVLTVANKKVFIKLDIEGNEHKALSGARTFLQTVNVIGLFMEWMHHRYKHSGQIIVDILVREGFLPFDTAIMSRFLNPDEYYRWPENVFWMKR